MTMTSTMTTMTAVRWRSERGRCCRPVSRRPASAWPSRPRRAVPSPAPPAHPPAARPRRRLDTARGATADSRWRGTTAPRRRRRVTDGPATTSATNSARARPTNNTTASWNYQSTRRWDFDAPASTWMPSPPRQHTVTLTFNLWPPESNQVISTDNTMYVSSRLFKQFMRHRVTRSVRTNERTNEHGWRTVRKHNAFADIVGCRRHYKYPSDVVMLSHMTPRNR